MLAHYHAIRQASCVTLLIVHLTVIEFKLQSSVHHKNYMGKAALALLALTPTSNVLTNHRRQVIDIAIKHDCAIS